MVSLSSGKEVQKLVVTPTLLNASLHSLFIFSAIFFEELSSHAVGRRVGIWVTKQRLDRGKDRRHVVGRAPPVLKYVKADAPISVDIWMEHLREKFDDWRFVWVLFAEFHRELECAILKGSIMGTKDDGIPQHDVILPGSPRDPRWRVLLQSLEVSHKPPSSRRRHDGERTLTLSRRMRSAKRLSSVPVQSFLSTLHPLCSAVGHADAVALAPSRHDGCGGLESARTTVLTSVVPPRVGPGHFVSSRSSASTSSTGSCCNPPESPRLPSPPRVLSSSLPHSSLVCP